VVGKIFAFIIACALVAPNVAWGAHLAGHEQLASKSAVHTHHSDHAHELADDQDMSDPQPDNVDPEDGLTHDHGPSLALSGAVVLPTSPELAAGFGRSETPFQVHEAPAARSHSDSLLRPPRAA